MAFRVLVSDKMSEEGVNVFRESGLDVDVKTGLSSGELKEIIGEYDGLAIRSATKVTPDILSASANLKVVGRAGVGVDNIDLKAATEHGVVVMNTPGISAVTVAEHTLAMILATLRHISSATVSMKAGRWEKKRFQGRQLRGMTLGVVGMGNIGSLVVKRARAFGAEVIAYDPFISQAAASSLGVSLVELDEIWSQADIISLHVPLTDQTKNLVNSETLSKMKQGSYLINCSRGGIVDEEALAESLREGHLAGAGLDVYSQEPPPEDHSIFDVENLTCAPHLGASTREAQDAVAVTLAEQMVDFLNNGTIQNAVNVASVSRDLLERLGPWLTLARKLGALSGQLAPRNPFQVTIEYSGEVAKQALNPVTAEVLVGLISCFQGGAVNTINASSLAESMGLRVEQVKTPEHADYASTLGIKISSEEQDFSVVGTLFGHNEPRIVRIRDFEIDAVPDGHMLLLKNRDIPRIVGQVGTILGDGRVNIGRIHLSRVAAGGEACSLINIDSPAPDSVIESIGSIEGVLSVTQLEV